MGCITPQATPRGAHLASTAWHPGVRQRFERHMATRAQPARPAHRRSPQALPALGDLSRAGCGGRSRSSSLNSESHAIGGRESEPPIVAEKSGNADGAKARRPGTASQRNMGQTLSWSYP
jgi:hypothetical protein